MRTMTGLSKEELARDFSMDDLLQRYNRERQRRGLEPLLQHNGNKAEIAGKLHTLMSLNVVAINGEHQVKQEIKEEAPAPTVKKRKGATKWSNQGIIEVVKLRPPKRMTKRNPYAYYQTGKTVQQLLDTGKVHRRDLNWDEKQGYIVIHEPKKE